MSLESHVFYSLSQSLAASSLAYLKGEILHPSQIENYQIINRDYRELGMNYVWPAC